MNNKEILAPLYDKYGKEIKFQLLSDKDEKVVYEMETSDDVMMVMIMPHLTITRFHKYMRSLGLQQKLFNEKFNVAEVLDSYMIGDHLVSVQKKLKGTNTFARNNASMTEIGKLVGKLHKLTSSPQYRNTFLLVNYPDKKRRLKLKLYDFWFSKIANPLKYFSMHCYPMGICHRDVNLKNVMYCDDGKYYLIDFDVHRYQPFVEGISRFYNRKIKDKALFGAFLKGYEKERPLSSKEREYLKKVLKIAI
jgi:serine/threonine protein kinase